MGQGHNLSQLPLVLSQCYVSFSDSNIVETIHKTQLLTWHGIGYHCIHRHCL